MGGMGIDVNVEFGGRRHVAGSGGATHEDDFANLRHDAGRADDGRGDVGERPGGGQGHSAVRRRQQGLDDEVDGVHVVQRHHRIAEAGAIEAGLAVDLLGRHQGPFERRRAAGVNADIGASGQLANASRVGLGEGQGHVAGDGRDTQHVELNRRGEGEQERHGIVVAGVAIDDDGARRHGANCDNPGQSGKPLMKFHGASRAILAPAPPGGR